MTSFAQKTLLWAQSKKIPLWFSPETGSTNTVAKDQIVDADFVSLYLTEKQIAGRGRNQNTWLHTSEIGGQIFSSWVFALEHSPQPILAPRVGFALYEALTKNFGSHFALKAPNDIYMGPLKIAGSLIENVQQGAKHRLIIGIGLNVTSKPALATAGCLQDQIALSSLEKMWEVFLEDLLRGLTNCVLQKDGRLSILERKNILEALNRHHFLKEPYVAIDENGSLKSSSQTTHWSDL